MRNASRNDQVATPVAYAYTFVACIASWICGYIYSVGYPVYGKVMATPLWNFICQYLPNKLFTYVVGIVLMVGGGFLLHRANYVLMLIREKTFLPLLFYILFVSTNPYFFPFKSASLGVFCLIFAIYQLFTSYHDDRSMDKAFNAALLIGIGSLLWVHLLWYLPLFWYGMYLFRSISVRTLVASLLGVTTVYWFVLGWCVWQNDFTPLSAPFASLCNLQWIGGQGDGLLDWVGVGYVALLATAAALNILIHEHEDNLRTRQFLSYVILMTVWSFALFLLFEQSAEEFLEVACVPASILIAHLFTVVHRRYIFWLFHFTIILLIALFVLRLWIS